MTRIATAVALAALALTGLAAPAAHADPLDSTWCPILASLAPGIPGIIDITAEGDTYTVISHDPIGGTFEVYRIDCPPYGN
jgi:hypothetical protein